MKKYIVLAERISGVGLSAVKGEDVLLNDEIASLYAEYLEVVVEKKGVKPVLEK